MTKVKDGDKVKVHYTGTLEDGTVFDSSKDSDPIEFTVGGGQVIAGFNNAVVGMAAEETTTVDIASTDAYGPHREELVVTVPRTDVPDDMEVEPGKMIAIRTGGGDTFPATIIKVTDDEVTFDGNHPLAGKDLTFEITVTDVTSGGDAPSE